MTDNWPLLALLGALGLGAYQILKKSAVTDAAVFPTSCYITGFASLPILLLHFTPLREVAGQPIPGSINLPASVHAIIAFKSVIVCTSWLLSLKSLKHLHLSTATPVRESGPLWTLLGALILFGERPTQLQWISIVLFVLAIFIISRESRPGAISHTERSSNWVALMLLAALLGAASSLIDKQILQNLGVPPIHLQAWYAIYNIAVHIALGLMIFRQSFSQFRIPKSAITAGLVLFFADFLYYHAVHVDNAPVSMIAFIRRASFLVPFGWGIAVLREPAGRMKYFAVAFIISAVILNMI